MVWISIPIYPLQRVFLKTLTLSFTPKIERTLYMQITRYATINWGKKKMYPLVWIMLISLAAMSRFNIDVHAWPKVLAEWQTDPHQTAHLLIEPRHDKTYLQEFSTRPDTNRHAQPQKLTIASRDIILSKQRTTKALIRLCGCAGWSAPLTKVLIRLWGYAGWSTPLLFAYDIGQIFSWPGSTVWVSTSSLKLRWVLYA